MKISAIFLSRERKHYDRNVWFLKRNEDNKLEPEVGIPMYVMLQATSLARIFLPWTDVTLQQICTKSSKFTLPLLLEYRRTIDPSISVPTVKPKIDYCVAIAELCSKQFDNGFYTNCPVEIPKVPKVNLHMIMRLLKDIRAQFVPFTVFHRTCLYIIITEYSGTIVGPYQTYTIRRKNPLSPFCLPTQLHCIAYANLADGKRKKFLVKELKFPS